MKIDEKTEKAQLFKAFFNGKNGKAEKALVFKLFVCAQDSSCQVCIGVGGGKNAWQWQKLKKHRFLYVFSLKFDDKAEKAQALKAFFNEK